MRYIIGLIIVVVGALLVIKTDDVIRMFGRSAWAEAKLGGGGSWTFYKGIGIIAIIFGFMVITNTWTYPLDLLFGRR